MLKSLEERFWEKVNIIYDETSCWEFTGAKHQFGYGIFRESIEKNEVAHRAILKFLNIDITEKVVCHKCDNPPCVRPSHLFVGTQKDNIKDMYSKNRQNLSRSKGASPRGEAHGRSKLSLKEVKEIRISNLKVKDLSNIYNISIRHIYRIKNNERWGD